MKKMLLITVLVVILLVSLIVIVLGKNPFLVLGVGILVLFLLYALLNLPKKHKDYSLSDQKQATSRALGGSGATDLLDIKPSCTITKKRQRQ